MTLEQKMSGGPSTLVTTGSIFPEAGSRASSLSRLQISTRPSRAICRPRGGCSVVATCVTAAPSASSGEMRKILPSATPAQMLPTASATTSSGPWPGSATMLSRGSGCGFRDSARTPGGCQRTGSIDGLAMEVTLLHA
ncbi:Uncharacterised protein [Mycobacteroides abscessus subsp. abscessus]|nr:Uncharacterised protein [Mycobacteroides abscessus subsp. abscessus]SHS98412.1 Uncharacterised protein [Mycobacteroides abscessus subsp. abscessus]SKW51455.1 Uncharacterised protein [Mycobacteroides abscessus subsp. abscessus]